MLSASSSGSWPARRVLLLVATGFVLLGLAIWWFYPRTRPSPLPADKPPADPRLDYKGPFENIHPSIAYTGDAACIDCHLELALKYAKHPMGRSAAPMSKMADKLPLDSAHHNPFEALGVRLRIERRGDRHWHIHGPVEDGKYLYEFRQEAQHVIGSGTRGYSYLTERDGFVFQTPISWYSSKQIWDLSPGFSSIRLVGRSIMTNCLQCHVNQTLDVPGTVARYKPGVIASHAIGCERCHGPGQKHVDAHEQGVPLRDDFDPTIVNPRHLTWQLRDNVCEQCHLGGETRFPRRGRDWYDYRPGMPLETFLSIHTRNPQLPGNHKAVSQVEQMRESVCFTKSPENQKLGCISCHDPHFKPTQQERVAYFQSRCLKCHSEKGCSMNKVERIRQQPGDNCSGCHMPKNPTTDIAHTALTDHRILRHAEKEPTRTGPVILSGSPIVNFYRDRLDTTDTEQSRDLALALSDLVLRKKLPPREADAAVYQVTQLLQESLKRGAWDPTGWMTFGAALSSQGKLEEAIAAHERAYKQMPKNEYNLERLAILEFYRKNEKASLRYLREAVDANPTLPHLREELIRLLAKRAEWNDVEKEAKLLLQRDPGSVSGRRYYILALADNGKPAEAKKEFELLKKLQPQQPADYEQWRKATAADPER